MTSRNGEAAIASLIDQLGRQVQNLCFTEALAPVQWSALRYLAKASPRARTASGLAAYSGVNLSSASRTVQLLLAKSLVSVSQDPHDSRVRLVSLTDAGWALLEQDPLGRLQQAVAKLSEAEQTALRDCLVKILFDLHPKPFTNDPPE